MAHSAGRSLKGSLVLLSVILVTLSFISCSESGIGGAATATPGGSFAPTAPGTPDRDRDGVPDANDTCDGQQEDHRWSEGTDGCPDTIDDLMNLAQQDINGYWARTFQAAGITYTPPKAVVPYTSAIQTGCGEAEPDNAFYCTVDNTIYYDAHFLAQQLAENGDFGPVYVIAHEWGHLAQTDLRLLQSASFTIEIELQADCFAGSYAQDAARRQLLEENDLDEAASSLIQAGDPRGVPWFAEGAHGSARQRLSAFQTGFEGGLQRCL